MFVEKFMPQEYIATCPTETKKGWKAYGNMIISGTFYHDDNNDNHYFTTSFLGPSYQDNEKRTLNSGAVPTGASATDNDIFIEGDVPAYDGNDGKWYSDFSGLSGRYKHDAVGSAFDFDYTFSTPFFIYNGLYVKSTVPVTKTVKNLS